jgi:hypothetical protein
MVIQANRFADRLDSGVRCQMTTTARSILLAGLVLLFLVTPAHASGSLSFSGEGYWVDLEIGQTEVPVVASIRGHRPGDEKGVVLSPKLIIVEAFDTRRQMLVLRFMGSGGANPVEPFILSANGGQAVLQIGAERVVSQFSWEM